MTILISMNSPELKRIHSARQRDRTESKQDPVNKYIRLTYNTEVITHNSTFQTHSLNNSQGQGSSGSTGKQTCVASHFGHCSVGGLSLARSSTGGLHVRGSTSASGSSASRHTSRGSRRGRSRSTSRSSDTAGLGCSDVDGHESTVGNRCDVKSRAGGSSSPILHHGPFAVGGGGTLELAGLGHGPVVKMLTM